MDVGAENNGFQMATCYIRFYTNIQTYDPIKACNTYNTYSLSLGLAYLIGTCGGVVDGLQLAYHL